MNILPFNKLVIHTDKSIPEIKEILTNHIDEKRMFNVLRSNKKYQGEIFDDGFKVSRIIFNRNSFLPTLNGCFKENTDGTDIVVKFELSGSVIAFMIVLGLGILFSFLKANGNFFEIIFLIAFFGILPIVSIKLEEKKTREMLTDILN